MEKKKISYKVLILVAAALVLGLFAGCSLWKSNAFVDRVLAGTADELNKTLPMMVDSDTRLDTTMALPNKTFNYMYTLVNYSVYELDADELENLMRPIILNNLRTSTDIQYFKDNDVILVYTYRDKDGLQVIKLTFESDEYK